VNDPRGIGAGALEQRAGAPEQPSTSYAGRTHYTQLEYEALLANLAVGIAFTRERKFFLCNPRFAEMFGYRP
jgi:PAS domain-containing protein